ncbi:MAG TPA: sigma 54-interacting transcriptional regulator [Vicinamibacterales bacterium]|nr:sigma 54-interacting transcriptional regulator [Vicinamibacterales bacterium]
MHPYADRFVPLDSVPIEANGAPAASAVSDGYRHLDLATGRVVCVRRMPAGDARDQTDWLDRLARLTSLWHPHLVPIVDFGLVGQNERFEAFALTRPTTLRADVVCAIRSALWFLRAVGASSGAPSRWRIRSLESRPVLIPDEWTGCDPTMLPPEREADWKQGWRALVGTRDGDRHVARDGSSIAGVVLYPRSVETGVLEVLDQAGSGRASQMIVTGEAGAGLGTLALALARGARKRGYVPLCPAALATLSAAQRTALGDRSLFILGDGRSAPDCRDRAAEAMLLEAAARGGGVALLLTIARSAEEGAIPIDRLSEPALLDMIHIFPPGRIPNRRIRRAARLATGNPGRLVATLVSQPVYRARTVRLPSRVAETQPAYAVGPPSTAGTSIESDRWHSRALKGMTLAAAGRHAAAERVLREAAAGLRRHGDGRRAAACTAILAQLLVDRGRPRDAHDVLEWLLEVEDVEIRLNATLGIGECLIDEGRLKEAERALRAACSVTTHDGPTDITARRARLALARCLFWQARYDEASEWVAPAVDAGCAAALRRLSAIALARSDTGAAGRLAGAAVERSQADADERERARAHAAAIRALAELGERDAVLRHANEGVRAAHRARAPLAALDVRLAVIAAAACDVTGRPQSARALERFRRERLPPLWRARLDAVRALVDDNAGRRTAARAAVSAFIRTSGALALQTPATLEPRDVARTVVELLNVCHQADDDDRALGKACAALRERLRAAGIAIFGDLPREERIAVAGSFDRGSEIVGRALSSGVSIAPLRGPRGIEAVAPVRYAGEPLGALACRWALDADVEARALASLLEASAAALGPAVRAWLDRRDGAPPPGGATDRSELVAASPQMIDLGRAIHRAASAPYPVLVEGESGVGKELVARAVHRCSSRRGRRFVAVNCAALPDELIEAELFGHARGAFTGAAGDRAGLFEEADGGTLFLDEVSELAPRAQAKLLRALQDGEIRRVGENAPRRVDVRIVAASNRPLDAAVTAGRFRTDLLFRLAVIRLGVAPLRERPADIHALVCQFWRTATERTGSRATLDPDTLAALARYDWPGNVRELQNVVSALAVYAPRRGRVGVSALPPAIAAAASVRPPASLDEARRAFERQFVSAALAQAGGHQVRAAGALGVSRQGLAKLIKRLGLDT